MKKDFQITISSDVDYEKLIAEITYGDELICVISDENDDGRLQIEFCPMKDGKPISAGCDLTDFEETLQMAKKELKGC